jgi:hypothetical protein
MNETTRELLSQVLALPEDQQTVILEALLEAVPEGTEELEEGALRRQLNERRADVARGTASGVRWEDLNDEPPGAQQ